MKKTTFLSIFTLLFTLVLTTSVSAKEEAIPEWFIELPQDSINTPLSESKTMNKTGNNYVFLHNNGETLDTPKVNEFIEGSIDTKELGDFNLLGVGIYTLNGENQTDFIFSNSPKEKYTDILDDSLNKAKEVYSQNNSNNQVKASSKNSSDSNTFRINNGSILAGIYTSNTKFLFKANSVLNGRNVSVWDVKYFNQSEPKSSYQTREIITRFSVSDWANQTLRSYGPTTTSKNSTASVSINGIIPTFSWGFQTFSSTVVDSSSLSGKYARWTFKPSLGSATAKNSYVMEPGARITNAVGSVGFKTTHNIDYYKNLNSQKIFNTGGITRFLNDR